MAYSDAPSIQDRVRDRDIRPPRFARRARQADDVVAAKSDRAEERWLFARVKRDGDRAAHEALVERFLPLAQQLARRYARSNEPLDDLIQVASLGLLKAIDRFDPTRPTAFSSFAVPTILGELKRHFRDKSWSLRVPRDLQELAFRVERVADNLESELRRAPTADEIAQHMGVRTEQVLDAREAAGAYRAISLDRPRDDAEAGDELVDGIGVEDPGYDLADEAATLERLMSVLSDREREVLRLRFAEDLTQLEIGARLGLSQMHISRLIRQAVAQLHQAADRDTSTA
ncbi:MAG TPA: SigB/SigF/SigG family RNA polymerase sigma factor [Solirubrobacteraceae bacterium]|nr:SigB/SigF/SigG family RNA polymerase sigma factor [Solirubrobacteraceae bacterium]